MEPPPPLVVAATADREREVYGTQGREGGVEGEVGGEGEDLVFFF